MHKGEDGSLKEYHILSLSGGKDSTALAFFIRDNMPEIHEQIEYVFCDTECELPETYEYLDKIEVFLDKPIKRLKPYMNFDHLYQIYNLLPSIRYRWCTIEMKTKVFRKYLYDRLKEDNGTVNIYIGIRADEAHRAENSINSTENFINQIYPFLEHGLQKQDITQILEKNGIGFPDYYKWRSRSGCYFCFFQRKIEWVNLYEKHPDLFKKAMEYEREGSEVRGKNFTWCQDMSLKELIKPQNIKKIKEKHEQMQKNLRKKSSESSSNNLFDIQNDEDNCIMCHV